MNIPKINFGSIKGAATSAVKSVGKFASKNAPALAGGAAIACTIGAVVLAVKATKKYEEEIQAAEIKKNAEHLDTVANGEETTEEFVPLSKKERLLIAAKCYWLVALLTVLSSVSTVASVKFSNKQIQALAVLASASEAALNRNENAIEEMFGKGKLEKVKMAANTEELKNTPLPSDDLIEQSALGGSTLMYECMSGRYFYGDITSVERAVNELNATLLRDCGYVSLNEFYNALGIRGVTWGEYLGWELDTMGTRLIDVRLEYDNDAHQRPVVLVKCKTEPKHDWRSC